MRRQISGSQVFQWPAFPEQQFPSCTLCNPFQSRRVRCTGSKNSQERSLSSIIYKSLTISVKIISYSQYKKAVYDRNVLYDSPYKLCLTLSLFIYLKKLLLPALCYMCYPKILLLGISNDSTILPVCSHFYFDEFMLSLCVFVVAACNKTMDFVHAKNML